MNSLLLSEDWDLTLTVGGNLAVISGTGRIVQDVASYERVFLGEGWYDQDAGIPYLMRELAALPPAELVTARANRRGLEVPGVAAINTVLTEFRKRTLHGIIRVKTAEGAEAEIVI